MTVRLDPDGIEADVCDPRPPPGCDQQPLGPCLAPIAAVQDAVLTVAPRGGHLGVEEELDAVAPEDLW
jgi:hypothetical protein